MLDPSGRPVTGAAVRLVSPATGYEATKRTDALGGYRFSGLLAGDYELTASAPNFQPATRRVALSVAGQLSVDVSLSVETLSTTLEVREAALEVNRQTAEVSTVFSRDLVQNLPLNGRSFHSLLELTPGVVLAPARIDNQGQFAINGQRTNANYFMVDGVSANIAASASAQMTQQAAGTLPGMTILGTTSGLVSVDALQEFRVATSSYSAEYGRSPGGQIILLTRSGTNSFRGTLYNYFRNEKLDANDWFANSQGLARLPLRQNNFGGTLGGPASLPGLYDGRNRTFFFVSYEGLRLLQPQASIRSVLVPSVSARQRAQGAARAVLEAFPLPNAALVPGDSQTPDLARYEYGISNPSRFHATSIRADHRFSARAQAFARWNLSPSRTQSRVFANQHNQNEIHFHTFTAGLTLTLTPSLVSDLRVNWSGSDGVFLFQGLEIDGAKLPPDSLLFGSNVPRETSSVTLNIIGGGQPVSLSQGRTLGNDQRQWNFVETVSWYRSGHQMKFGFDYRLLLPQVKFRSLAVTHAFNTRGSASNGVTDLLETGRVNTTIQALAPVTGFRIHNFSAFAQDSWRVSSRLNLNYGIRWEINPPPGGRLLPYRLDQVRDPLTAQLAPPNTPLYDTQWLNLAPRAGMALQLNRSGDLVLRAGGGMFFDLGNGPALRGYTSFPYNSTRTLQNEPWPVPQERIQPAPFNTSPPYSATFYIMHPQLMLPFTWQWNVSLEKALGSDQMVTLSYAGSRAERLLRTELLRNRSASGAPIHPVIHPELFSPNASVFITRNEAASRYHSLQAQFQRRMVQGLQALVSYTWSKAIDNVSDEATATLPVTGIGQFDLALDREFARASFDLRHMLSSGFVWKLPSPRTDGFLRAIGGGWAMDGIVRLRSGFPFHVITQVIDPLNFGSNRRVDYAGGPNWIDDPNAPRGRRLNPAAFRIPPDSGRQGTLGRNALTGFPARQLDLAVRREFGRGEPLRLAFRAELFNALNHPNFGLPNASLNPFPDPFFGQARQMLGRSLGAGGTSGGLSPLYQVGGPRSVQLSLRLSF